VVTQQWAKWKVSAPKCLQIAWKTRTVRNTPRRNLSKNNEKTHNFVPFFRLEGMNAF
jgi:uncharacterized membrane protein